MRTCHLGTCPGDSEQFAECRRRDACHEAGHALVVCLVAATGARRCKVTLTEFIFGTGAPGKASLALPEENADTPWNDALVLLGGPAADAEIYGQVARGDDDDCVRAKRLLRAAGERLDLFDALSVTRELVAHHVEILQTLAGEVLRKGRLLGSEAWQLFQSAR